MGADFSGYATKANLKCTDGRTILPGAFKGQDGQKVPLVWKHIHDDPGKVLGHVVLEAREDGMYARGYFNQTKQGQIAKELVLHKDIDSMSIYANQLSEKQGRNGKMVEHGVVREVSLVLSGANSGAKIDFVSVRHSADPDDVEVFDDEAIIHMYQPLEFEVVEHDDEDDDEIEEDLEHAEDDEETVADIYNSMNQKQKDVVSYFVGAALEKKSAEHSDETPDNSNSTEGAIAHQEGTDMGTRTHNIFETNTDTSKAELKHTITRDDVKNIFARGKALGSFKMAAQEYVQDHLEHGITSIDVLFPDAKAIGNTPEFDKRRTEWVSDVLNSTRHTPFARIKTLSADLTQDQARAKGYIKGSFKKEEWFGVTKRVTTPTTVYKKQKLDRDDILDITEFEVVAWLMAEMRLMLEEEIARAILIGDGRDISDEDKVKDPAGASSGDGIRSIYNDHELYVHRAYVNVGDSNSTYDEVVDAVMGAMIHYKGTGTPAFYSTTQQMNKFKQAKDTTGRRLYEKTQDVCDALGVSRFVNVEPMNEIAGLIGIIVNLQDYNIGTDKGGDITTFDDFDIDYNQYKYLIETRLSGALVKLRSAILILETTSTNVLATPTKPAFVKSTGVVTIPTVTGVVYKKSSDNSTITAGAMSALAAGASIDIYAAPASGYYFMDNKVDGPWTFTRDA